MKCALLCLLGVVAVHAKAQFCHWDVHPLNTIPCSEWIYPEPGCGGCSSCRSSVDTDPTMMDGSLLQWSDELVLCPHPVDNIGNNAVIVNNWPVSADANSYLYGRVDIHQPMRIDTLELTCAAWSPELASVELAVQFNETDPLTTITLLTAELSGDYQRFIVTDMGNLPLTDNGTGFANFFVRTHGQDVWLLFKGLRIVASPDGTASMSEQRKENVFILPTAQGVTIASAEPVEASVCDATGRVTWRADDLRGTSFIPLPSGLSIVRAGTQVRRVVR